MAWREMSREEIQPQTDGRITREGLFSDFYYSSSGTGNQVSLKLARMKIRSSRISNTSCHFEACGVA